MKRQWIGAALALSIVLSSPSITSQVRADALGDAKTALAEKRYDDVDKALEAELSQKSPSVDALHVSLDAARAAGKVVTAERRIASLLKATQNQDADLLYAAAQLAEQTGDVRLALTRYLAYARLKGDKTDQLERALVYVLKREAYTDEYKKYVTVFGATDRAWELGSAMLGRLLEASDVDRSLDLADFLMAKYPAPENVYVVHGQVYTAAQNFLLGKDPKERYVVPLTLMAKGVPNNWNYLSAMIDGAAVALDNQTKAQITIDQMTRSKLPLTSDMLSKFAFARSIENEDTRVAMGKAYLTFEPLYRDSTAPNAAAIYEAYVRQIWESPTVFNVANKALVKPAEIVARWEALKAKCVDNPATAYQHIPTVDQWLAADAPTRIAFLQKNIAVIPAGHVAALLSLTENANQDAVIAQNLAGKSFRYSVESRVALFPNYLAAKNKAALLQAAKDYLAINPFAFNWQHLKGHVINSDLFTPEERLALLTETITKAGVTPPMVEMVTAMAVKEDPAKWSENPNFPALQALVAANKPGTDLATSSAVKLAQLGANPASGNPAAFEIAKAFLAGYPGVVPVDVDHATNAQEFMATAVFAGHWANVVNNAAAVFAFSDMWAPKLQNGGTWELVLNRVREHQGYPQLWKLAPIYVASLKPGDNGTPQAWYNLATAAVPSAEELVAFFSPHYEKMGSTGAFNVLFNQRDALFVQKRPLLIAELTKVITSPWFKFNETASPGQLIHHFYYWSSADVKIAPAATKKLWEAFLAQEDAQKHWDSTTEAFTYGHYIHSGELAEGQAWLTNYIELVKKRPIADQFAAINGIIGRVDIPRENDPPAPAAPALKPGMRLHTILKVAKPIFDQMPANTWDRLIITGNLVMEVATVAKTWPPDSPDRAEAYAFGQKLTQMFTAGATTDGPSSWQYALLDFMIKDAVTRKDMTEAGRLVGIYSNVLGKDKNWPDAYPNWIVPIAKVLEDAQAYELVFSLIDGVERFQPEEVVAKQLAIVKARSATKIANMVPVAPGDPSYDLYVAANAFQIGDEGKAWELTQPKALDVLPKVWESLDINYVAWTADQMRKQKGPMLKPALEFTMSVLLREADLDPEIAAKLSLTKGDIYANMENYQAARIEYEALRNNSRYNKTEAGSRALYRLINLLILTKDYTTAEGMLERIVDSDDLQVQAEAYYLFAKMSYQQGEYKAAKDYVTKVKERDSNHVEALLLEGDLKLYLPNQLGDAEVAIGEKRLGSVIVPGRTLTLSQMDPNLSIAKAGTFIPVIVSTTAGDVEHVRLDPSPSNKNQFVGTISTALGKPQKDNVLLELNGNDVVSYIIDPEFQKANGLTYAAKTLEVRSDARLVASSGEILSEEEEEKRQMELKLQRNRDLESRRMDVGRDGRTIRPGSPIYVQVTDFDRDLTDDADSVTVDLKTASGDVLEGFKVLETGPHTGIFRAQVPTAIPLPKATASDSDMGHEPSGVINSTKPGAWTSIADGAKPKWFGVDTMSSYEINSVVAEIPQLSSVRELAVLGALSNDDFEELAVYPERTDQSAAGGLEVEVAPEQRGEQPDQIVRFIKLAGDPKQTYSQPGTVFSRADTSYKGRDGTWMTNRLRGSFFLPQNMSLELKFLQTLSPNNWQHAYVYIDGRLVMGGNIIAQTIGVTKKIDLAKGPHKLEVLVRDAWVNSQVNIGYRKDDGTFETLPAEWFSPTAHPELVDFLKPKGKIEINGDTLTTTLLEAKRLRNVRIMFKDFTGTAVSVKTLTVKDTAGTVIVPVKEDFTASTTNGTLEISPGDDIQVTYADKKRLKEETPTISANLNSSFFNATVMLANEVFSENERHERHVEYFPAKRCRVGDQLLVVVSDYDMDTTNERDSIDATVTTSSGESVVIKCLETWPNYGADYQNHSGTFVGILHIGDKTEKDTLKVVTGDNLNATYLDKENTIPGVPIDRTYSIFEAGSSKPEILVYRTDVVQVEDKSDEAAAKRRRMQGRNKKEALMIYKDLVVATHPEYHEAAPTGKEQAAPPVDGDSVSVSVSAPLLFEINYPKMALNSGSVFNVSVVSESEMKAAQTENRKPNVTSVPTYIQPIDWLSQIKGYPIQLKSHIRRDAIDLLKDGTFSGVLRLQVGKPGDPVDDLVVSNEKEFVTQKQRETEEGSFYYRVPTIIVAGNDVVHLRVDDGQGNVISEQKVRLLSNGRLELLDSAYIAQNESIHMGEKFYVRVTDPDQDMSDDRDNVKVLVKSMSPEGEAHDQVEITLAENLNHSGAFTGMLKPEFIGEKGADGKLPVAKQDDDVLSVTFGDEVSFTYVDKLSLLSANPVEVNAKGKIFFGSDGEVAVFSKQFKDPEIAVKTRFLMAEALFEMAKEHRKLNQAEEADKEISRGKFILEEALRDYPDTSYAVQGEYLLANLAQELGNFQEAIGRYSHVISGWPDSEFAPESQYKMAICFERMQQFDKAMEEYVRLTYVFPESPKVADATVRLGNYYYKKQSYPIAGKIFYNFQQKNPGHDLAPQALFLAAQCAYKQIDWMQSIKLFQQVVDEYPDSKDIRAEAMYWLADSQFKANMQVKSYQGFKKLTWDYPDSKWAKIARGRLTEEVFSNIKEE